MGVMMIRVWSGGGVPESDEFYDLCDELGLMVWQDNLLANNETSNWNHDALLQQVCYNLFRIRNHPSLVIHCGGNEFNPYSRDNLASVSVIENAIQDLDPSREWVRTTPYLQGHGALLVPDHLPPDPLCRRERHTQLPQHAGSRFGRFTGGTE